MVCRLREPRFGLVITEVFTWLKIWSARLLVKATPPLATGNPSFRNFIFIMPLLSIHLREADSLNPGRGKPSKIIVLPAPPGPWYSATKPSRIGPRWNSFIFIPRLAASSQKHFVRQVSLLSGLSEKYPSFKKTIKLKKGRVIL